MHWLTGDWRSLGTVAAKATAMYLVAVLGLRVSQRRTLAQWDVLAKLREQGILDLAEVRYALYETKGDLTIIREAAVLDGDPQLVVSGLTDAAGFADRRRRSTPVRGRRPGR